PYVDHHVEARHSVDQRLEFEAHEHVHTFSGRCRKAAAPGTVRFDLTTAVRRDCLSGMFMAAGESC
ncbi:MAG: hypothetical protein OXJ64_00090, partial [Boseongicola sp.]|nr:hypothetical protein [Boseongicola sp.]